MTPVRLEPAASRSRVKHSTTEPLHSLPYGCIVTINVLWLSLTVPWVGLQYMIVVFPDHTRLLFGNTGTDSHREASERPLPSIN